jgi:hypothetical protein
MPLSSGQSFVEKASAHQDDTLNANGTELPLIDSPAKIVATKKLINQNSYSTNALVNNTYRAEASQKDVVAPSAEFESNKQPFSA